MTADWVLPKPLRHPAGATQVLGTIYGYGERCGNANFSVIIPTYKLKLGIDCI
jgi:2-isopropylmalate synthase